MEGKSTSDLIQRVRDSFSPLYGMPCWNAKHGHGSFITFEFGEPHLEIHEPREPNIPVSPAVEKLLYKPSGNILTVRADGAYSYNPGDTPPSEKEWVPASV